MKTKFTLTVLMFIISANIAVTVSAQGTNVGDSLALVDLYNSCKGSEWGRHDNWLLTKPVSEWYGITVTDGRVTQISLYANKMSGSIPTSVGNLTNLDILFLGNNQLSGGIPSSIGNLVNLTNLSLGYNQLTGSIPAEMGNLTGLTYLYLDHNQLEGSIPAGVGNLVNLRGLYLNNNKLTGSIPPELGNLTGINYEFNLSFNQLSGKIPAELGNFVNLPYIYLNDNLLSGSIPAELGNMRSLVYLWLYNNKLSGSIPPEIGNLSNLRILNLYSNQLTGSIPRELGNLVNLNYSIDLSYNQLTGAIPHEFGNLLKIEILGLNNNQLSGNIPAELGNLSNLVNLYLNDNQLSGNIPASFGNLKSLYNLKLSNNKISGTVNNAIGNCTNLRYLMLDHNRLKGNIYTAIATLTLYGLNISFNRFTFDGIEQVVKKFPFAVYNNQARIPVHLSNNALSVSAGGTLSNNTYRWYIIGQKGYTQITADSVFHAVQNGTYYVKVSNSICTQLILNSDTMVYTAPASLNNNILSAKNGMELKDKTTRLFVYPNPAKDVLHIDANPNTSFSLVNQAGKTVVTTSIVNNGSMNISGFAGGLYYLKNNSSGAVQKVMIME